MKYILVSLVILSMSQLTLAIEGAQRTSMGNIADGADQTDEAMQKEKKLCDKYTKMSQQPNGQQYKPKAEEHCKKAEQAAGQQGALGQGMGEALKNLASVLPALAQMMQKKGGSTGIGDNGFVEDPPTTVAALEAAGLSAGEARRFVSNNLAAKSALESGSLGGFSAGGGSGFGSGGLPGLAASGGAQLATEGSAEETPKGESQAVEVAALNPLGGGGGAPGGGGGGGGGAPPADDFALDPLPEFSLDKPKDGPRSADGPEDFTTLDGEKIGVTGDNIFEKLSRRYQYLKFANGFITED